MITTSVKWWGKSRGSKPTRYLRGKASGACMAVWVGTEPQILIQRSFHLPLPLPLVPAAGAGRTDELERDRASVLLYPSILLRNSAGGVNRMPSRLLRTSSRAIEPGSLIFLLE